MKFLVGILSVVTVLSTSAAHAAETSSLRLQAARAKQALWAQLAVEEQHALDAIASCDSPTCSAVEIVSSDERIKSLIEQYLQKYRSDADILKAYSASQASSARFKFMLGLQNPNQNN